jgi:lipoprotein-anchoring transpeptidase ErfK/SrfK
VAIIEKPAEAPTSDSEGGESGGRRRWWLAAALGAVVLALIATTVVILRTRSDTPTAAPGAPPPELALHFETAAHGKAGWEKPLALRADHGFFTAVEATDGSGAAFTGYLSPDGDTWWSLTKPMPATTYTMNATGVDAAGHRFTKRLSITTADPRALVTPTITPGDNDVVGVGMPISVRFNSAVPIAGRVEMERHLTVTTFPVVQGGWRWMSNSEVRWRPAEYWPAHTTVKVNADVDRANFTDGVWGKGSRASSFTIGDAHLSTADAATHMMTVTSNGAVVRTMPMSAGRQQYPTRSGVHLALSREQMVTMDSATVGIPRNAPDGYFEKVYWNVRITNSGEFVHAAPWSVGSQGRANVSHGCINLSPADAQWFYGFTQRGDVINVLNAGGKPNLSDPGMADWNIPWAQWATPAAVPAVSSTPAGVS